ncbi:MAG: hypothetical protein LQ344_001978 [Seirophora lacunosa]|nr:MAG: hypothetical protein LQ344_001978 [Seirophora lacunosa]
MAPVNRVSPAILERLQDISAWIRAHPNRAFVIFGGTIILGLTCAIPAVLQAAGFGVLGPVAGSIAAGWHSSLGLVVAGTPFAFLQSAGMGGAAMGLMIGSGAVIGGATIAAALTLGKERIAGLASSCEGAVNGALEKIKWLSGKS